MSVFSSGLTVSGEALRDLYHMLRYQKDVWAGNFARVQIVLSAQLNGVTLTEGEWRKRTEAPLMIDLPAHSVNVIQMR